MYTDRRIGQYTVVTPRAAIVWSVAIHLVAFIGSAWAWEDAVARPERGQKVTAGSIPDSPFLFWERTGVRRGEEPAPLQAVVDAITRFAPAAARKPRPTNFIAREYLNPAWLPQAPVEADAPVAISRGYDSFVLASAGAFFFPGTENLLSGDKVYTVYLRATSGRDWILQFGAPDTATAIDPPYPAHAVIPQVTLTPEAEYMVIHGMINAQGRFEKLAIVGDQPLSPDPDTFLRLLTEWELQPATIDGGAVPVDIVLIVPNSGADAITGTPPLP